MKLSIREDLLSQDPNIKILRFPSNQPFEPDYITNEEVETYHFIDQPEDTGIVLVFNPIDKKVYGLYSIDLSFN
jgi:hypothetical protein